MAAAEAVFRNANPTGEQGIPIAAFEVDDIQGEFKKLSTLGVTFTQEPTRAGPVSIAVCSDTCGHRVRPW